jgi:hypothetical protein
MLLLLSVPGVFVGNNLEFFFNPRRQFFLYGFTDLLSAFITYQ